MYAFLFHQLLQSHWGVVALCVLYVGVFHHKMFDTLQSSYSWIFRISQCRVRCYRVCNICQCVGYMSLSGLLGLRAEESRVIRHVKPPRCGEASRKPRALTRVRTQAFGGLAQGSYPLSYPSAPTCAGGCCISNDSRATDNCFRMIGQGFVANYRNNARSN